MKLLSRAKRALRGGRPALSKADIAEIVALLNENAQPNDNALTSQLRNIHLLALNIKTMGYDLARELARTMPVHRDTVARHVGLQSKLSTQADMETDWLAHWCGQLHIPVVYHRKLWELAYILQAVHDSGGLRPGARGLGFGCGAEPIASYLASNGVAVTITDLAPDDDRVSMWSDTNQHAAEVEAAYHPALVDRATFDRLVRHQSVDMNAIPDTLRDYDFCWSMCALEHLSTIQHGLDFIENAMATLRPGGIAVHTTEFNINPDGPTIDNWMTVLFQRRHIEALADRLRARGHQVAPFDFDPGAQPLDRFIDLPPWHDGTLAAISRGLGEPNHLKVAIDGFVSTCFGIVVTKAM